MQANQKCNSYLSSYCSQERPPQINVTENNKTQSPPTSVANQVSLSLSLLILIQPHSSGNSLHQPYPEEANPIPGASVLTLQSSQHSGKKLNGIRMSFSIFYELIKVLHSTV